MAKRHKPDEIIATLRQTRVDDRPGHVVGGCDPLDRRDGGYYDRWRSEYGGVTLDPVKRLKELEVGDARLREAVSDLTLRTRPARSRLTRESAPADAL